MPTDLMAIDRQVTYEADAELHASVRSSLDHWCSINRVLRTTYLDTADLDLLKAGITLRQRVSVGKSGHLGKPTTEAKIPTEHGLLRVAGERATKAASEHLGIDLGRLDVLRPVAIQTKFRRLLLASGSPVAPDFVVALDVAKSEVEGRTSERHEVEAQLFTALPWRRDVDRSRIARFDQFRLRLEREFSLEPSDEAGYELVMKSAGVFPRPERAGNRLGGGRPEEADRKKMLYGGLTEGATLKTDTLFTGRPQLVVNASHVQVREHEGLAIVPIAEVFSNPSAAFIGFGKPNVFLTVPSLDGASGWEKFAAFMFWRKRSYVANTKGIVQGGVFLEVCNLSERAIHQLHKTMRDHQGRRTISCANATGKVLAESGFTSNGKSLARTVRPMTLAQTLWNSGLEFEGTALQLRFVNTNPGTLDDHFSTVLRKEWSSPIRAVAKLMPKKDVKTRAPKIDPRPLQPLSPVAPVGPSLLELRMGRPSKLAVLLRRRWGDHPIFEVRLNAQDLDIQSPEFGDLAFPLHAYPGQLDAVTKIKRYVLFARPVVRLIRAHMAKEMPTLGRFHGPVLVGMFQRQKGDEPFRYNVIITGTAARMARLENRNGKDVAKANWLFAKHVLLSGYDPDVRFAGEIWVEDTETGQKLWINNNSGTYKPSRNQADTAARFLERLIGVEVAVQPDE